jgi:cytochrome c-type biogenesis protein CcmE
LTVKGLLDQQDSMMFKDTKVCGYVKGEINDAQADFRFTIESQGETLKVAYDGGLDEAITDGTALVISGHLDSDGVFVATEQPSIDSSIKA